MVIKEMLSQVYDEHLGLFFYFYSDKMSGS
jgi:hypothetical protein